MFPSPIYRKRQALPAPARANVVQRNWPAGDAHHYGGVNQTLMLVSDAYSSVIASMIAAWATPWPDGITATPFPGYGLWATGFAAPALQILANTPYPS